MLRGLAKLAVAVMVAGPSFGKAIDDRDVVRWAHAGGVAYLIRAAWTEGEAAERQVSVGDAAVREAMDPPRDGLSGSDRFYEARVGLLDAALKEPILQAAAQSVTAEQIDAYVATHPKTSPERRRVRWIAAKSETAAKRVERALARGLIWTSAAKRFKGDLSVFTMAPGDVGEPLQSAIYEAEQHRTNRYRRVVFKVLRIEPERPLPTKQQRATAWEVLASEAQQRAIDAYDAGLLAKWRPRTTCAPAVATQEFCSNYPTGQ